MTLVHWDEVEAHLDEEGHFAATWRMLGRAAGAKDYTVNRIDIVPGRWSTPAHVEDEEIFYVLRGTGLSWQDGEVYEVREGDVHYCHGSPLNIEEFDYIFARDQAAQCLDI